MSLRTRLSAALAVVAAICLGAFALTPTFSSWTDSTSNTGSTITAGTDWIAPTVQSIVRADASPTSAPTVRWTVTFSETVSGVGAADFALAPTGSLTGWTVSAVTGSGTTYTVTASSGSGNGTLALNLVDDDTIADASANKLGGTGSANGNFSGQAYTVGTTVVAPTLNTVTAQNPASGQTTGAIAVGWSAVTGADGYNVYRRTAAGSFDYGSPLNGATLVSATSYTDPGAGLGGGTTYHYVVRTVDGSPATESPSSNELNATAIARPGAPSGSVTATALASSRVGVAWSSVASVAGYNIYRRTSAGSYDFNAPLNGASPVTATSYTDTTAASATTYLYTVRAVISGAAGAQVESASSAESNAATASGAAACDYPGSVLGTTGLASYWRLGETTGTTAADSKGLNTGTYAGGVTLGAAGAIAGDTNKSATFDGVDDRVSVPNATSLRPVSLTLEAWVKPSAGIVDYASIATKTTLNSWNDGYGMYYWGGNAYFWINDDATDYVRATSVPTGTWTHLVGTYDGATMRIYMNGVLAASYAYTSPIVHSTSALLIGDAAGTGNYNWTGGIDDVALYSGALSAATVQARFRCGQRYRDVVLGTSGLTSYWRLGESAGTGAFDSKGANNGAFADGVTLGAAGALTAPGDIAASFDGTNDHVSLGDPASLKLTNPSVEAWVKTSDTEGNLFRARYNGYQVYVSNGDPHVAFTDSGGNSYVASSTTDVNDNAWHHLVGTYDGTTLRLYMDGAEVGSIATSAAVHYPGGGMAIGRDGDSDGNYLAATIDEPAIYNRALTATEVAQHFRAR